MNESTLFDEIESCQQEGFFDEEYVYDIEMGDDTHTFIANDILVHNSCYVTFQDVLRGCDWTGDPRKLIRLIYEHRLEAYLNKNFSALAKQAGTGNIQNLEMETISHSAIFLKKNSTLS